MEKKVGSTFTDWIWRESRILKCWKACWLTAARVNMLLRSVKIIFELLLLQIRACYFYGPYPCAFYPNTVEECTDFSKLVEHYTVLLCMAEMLMAVGCSVEMFTLSLSPERPTVQWRPAPLRARVVLASLHHLPGLLLLLLQLFHSPAPAHLRKTQTSWGKEAQFLLGSCSGCHQHTDG